MSELLSHKIEVAVEQKVAQAVSPSTVPGNIQTVAPVTQAVMQEIGPVVDHLTNQEPWWQSRTAIAALIIVISRITAKFGYYIPEELHGPLTDIVIEVFPAVAVGLIVWARYVAKKPLLSSLIGRWRS